MCVLLPTLHFEYLVMPFGFANAPAVFQALINDVLRDMPDKFVFVYLDDILVFSRKKKEYVIHVGQVLQRLFENKLFAKASKCEFHDSTVGSIIERGQLKPDPDKNQAVLDWPVPTNHKQLQRVLGFCFFLIFINSSLRTTAELLYP